MNDATRNALKKLASGEVRQFKPQQAKKREAEANGVKEYARAVLDWDMLDDAVDQQIVDQQNFVDWWDENVAPNSRPKSIADRQYLSVAEAEKLGGIPDYKVSRWRNRLKGDREAYRDLLRGPSYLKAMGERGSTDQKGASGTGENEWFTPSEYIDLARQVMGGIDLDPASSARAQEVVQATEFYTKKDDGLKHQWRGRVWLNPPYAQPLIAQFVQKLCDEHDSKRVTSAILLTHNYTDTAWFHDIARCASAICFTRGRVKFYEPGGKVAAPTQGQAFSYFGEDADVFAQIFESIGFIARLQ